MAEQCDMFRILVTHTHVHTHTQCVCMQHLRQYCPITDTSVNQEGLISKLNSLGVK